MLNLNKSVINSTSVVSLYTATRLVASKAEPSKTFHDLPGPKIMPVIGSFASLKGFGKKKFQKLKKKSHLVKDW